MTTKKPQKRLSVTVDSNGKTTVWLGAAQKRTLDAALGIVTQMQGLKIVPPTATLAEVVAKLNSEAE